MTDDLQELFNKAYFFLKFRPRSKKEVYDYLLKKIKSRHWSTDHVKNVVRKLEEQRFIDDEQFVCWFIDSRTISKPKSEFILRGELSRFGIDKAIVDDYFTSHEFAEEDLAFRALQGKWYRFKPLNKRLRFEKAASFLSRRGFSFEIVRKTINTLEALS